MKPRFLIGALCAVLLAAGSAAHAGREARSSNLAPPAANNTPSAVRRLEALEDLSFLRKSRGDYAGALAALEQGLGIVFNEAESCEPEVRRELLAAGEVSLHLAFRLAGELSRYRELIPILAQAPDDAPVLRALADYLRLQCVARTGGVEEAARVREGLGLITDWHLIGPFDNERGGGFNTAYGPEQAVDLTAGYSGKERKVFWRRNPVASLTGAVNLNAVFKPSDQCLAYALCFIESDSAKTVCLRTGSDEALKVFLNGAGVHAIDARREARFDQDVVVLQLREGKNALLLKVCDRTGGWDFLARITELDGSRAEGITVTMDAAGYIAPPPGAADPAGASVAPGVASAPGAVSAPAAASAADRGARDVYEELTGNESERPLARPHLYLGLLHYFNEYEGDDSDTDTRYFERFLRDNPKHLPALTLLAQSRLRRTDMATEKDENPWRLGIEKTLEIDPACADSHLMLARYYTYSLWVPAAARRHVEAALAANPDFLEAKLLKARIVERTGLELAGRGMILGLGGHSGEIDSADLLGELGRAALADGRDEDAKKYYRSIVGLDFANMEAREALFQIARGEGDAATMLKLLAEKSAFHPYGTDSHLARADLLIAEERYDEACAAIEDAARINPDDDRIWTELGRAHHLAGRDEEALALYEKALDLDPKRDKLRRYVEFLKETAAPFEDAFKRDALELIAAHPPGDNSENNPHEYLLRQDVYRVNPDGTDSHYHHMVVRILNDGGAETFDVFYTGYALDEQRARIKTARVIRADGAIEEARIDNRVLREYERGGFVPAVADLPPLVPGDVVDIDYRIDGIRQSVFGNYFGLQHFFHDRDLQAVKEAELTLLLPAEREFLFNRRFLDVDPIESASADWRFKILTWNLRDLPKIDREPFMPERIELAPCQEVSSYRSWDEMTRWWWQLVDKQCDSSEELKSVAAKLTAGCHTEKEKIRAIYNFVVSEIRYNDTWEFGIHGFKPYRASAILGNRFGDCKDKAILIRSLLAEIGIEAYPVMIRLESHRPREDLTLPMIGHFNHAIAYVPSVDGGPGIFLDGTAKFHPVETLPDADEGASVVIVNPDRYEMTTIPYSNPADNETRTVFDVDLAAGGSAAVRVVQTARGTGEPYERMRFLNPGKRENELKSAFGSVFGEVSADKLEFSDMENLNAPVQYSFELKVKDIVLESGGGRRLRTAFFPLNLEPFSSLETRKTDLLIGAPTSRTSRITYRLPDGLAAERLPESVHLENDFAAYSLNLSAEGNTITIESAFEVRAPRVPAADYPVFRDFCRDIAQAEKRLIHLRKV